MNKQAKFSDFEALYAKVKSIADTGDDAMLRLRAICHLLKDNVPHYDWVGFYFVNPENGNELVLGPFAGEPTEHTRIPYGSGICGRVAISKEPLVIQDVSKEDNYLSCSVSVRSEIVMPIFRDGKFVGELDIDSHMLAPFERGDLDFLGRVSTLLANLI